MSGEVGCRYVERGSEGGSTDLESNNPHPQVTIIPMISILFNFSCNDYQSAGLSPAVFISEIISEYFFRF